VGRLAPIRCSSSGCTTASYGRLPRRYLHQLLAGAVWTSIFALPLIRQPTLVIGGLDDPIVPLANARIMHRLLRHSTLHLHSGGHVDLVANAAKLAPVIEMFRNLDRRE
jgi:pimeloyl-ACP methyl ester carboxylesterase